MRAGSRFEVPSFRNFLGLFKREYRTDPRRNFYLSERFRKVAVCTLHSDAWRADQRLALITRLIHVRGMTGRPGLASLSGIPSDVLLNIFSRLDSTDRFMACSFLMKLDFPRVFIAIPSTSHPRVCTCRRLAVPLVCKSWARLAADAESFWSELSTGINCCLPPAHHYHKEPAYDYFKVSLKSQAKTF